MARYKILLKESVRKDLAALPKKEIQKILHRIQTLAVDLRPSGSEKLTGEERYRVRQGRYRIL